MNTVEKYYTTNVNNEWERLERHRTEYAVTLRAFDGFLPKPPAKILDIGGDLGVILLNSPGVVTRLLWSIWHKQISILQL